MVYRELLRVPRLRALFGAVLVARLSLGIDALAIVLFLRAERGEFGVAGIVAGALALGAGLGAPLLGRTVDRLGRRMLAPIAVGHAVGLVALVLLGSTDVPAAVLVAVSFASGVSLPPVSSVMRVLYPELLHDRRELLPAAFAFDSVMTEMLFVLGPLIVAGLVAFVTPQAALLLSAVTVISGTLLFLALLPGSLHAAPRPAGSGGGRLGALASSGILTLVLTMAPFGAAFGMLEVILPAFTRAEGQPDMAGVVLACWSIASAAGGFAYGMRARTRSLADVHLRLALVLPLALAPLMAAPSIALMLPLVVLAGLPIAPLIASRNELAGAVAPVGAETEAYAWVLMAMVGGIALGNGLAGIVVDEAGWRTATLVAVAIAAAGAAMCLWRRGSLRAAVATA